MVKRKNISANERFRVDQKILDLQKAVISEWDSRSGNDYDYQSYIDRGLSVRRNVANRAYTIERIRTLLYDHHYWEYVFIIDESTDIGLTMREIRLLFNRHHVKRNENVLLVKNEATAIMLRLSLPEKIRFKVFKVPE